MSDLGSLIFGCILLSLIHAAIPNHWVPLVLVGKAEKWTLVETQWATLLTGFSHILSTVILGLIIGYIGYQLSEQYKIISEVVAPLILIFMGLIYFAVSTPHHHPKADTLLQKKSRLSVIFTLSLAMFLSPCLEIETYFFAAGTIGMYSIFAIAFVYLIVTLSGMILLVTLGFKSLHKYNWHFLEHHEKKFTGAILILVGIMSFFIKL